MRLILLANRIVSYIKHMPITLPDPRSVLEALLRGTTLAISVYKSFLGFFFGIMWAVKYINLYYSIIKQEFKQRCTSADR